MVFVTFIYVLKTDLDFEIGSIELENSNLHEIGSYT